MSSNDGRDNIQDLLIAWGRCRAVSDASHVGYPSITPFARHMRQSGRATVKVMPIAEDKIGRIDAAVGSLKRHCDGVDGDHRYKVLVMYYRVEDDRTLSDSAIARRLRIGRERVKMARVAAENWIESRLYPDP